MKIPKEKISSTVQTNIDAKDEEMEMVLFQSSLEAPEWAKDPRNGLISIGGKLAGPFGVHFRDP